VRKERLLRLWRPLRRPVAAGDRQWLGPCIDLDIASLIWTRRLWSLGR
jgi:hypothetical protein